MKGNRGRPRWPTGSVEGGHGEIVQGQLCGRYVKRATHCYGFYWITLNDEETGIMDMAFPTRM